MNKQTSTSITAVNLPLSLRILRNFYVFLTVHLGISLDNDQPDANFLYFTICQYNTTFLYMFRALHMLILRRL